MQVRFKKIFTNICSPVSILVKSSFLFSSAFSYFSYFFLISQNCSHFYLLSQVEQNIYRWICCINTNFWMGWIQMSRNQFHYSFVGIQTVCLPFLTLVIIIRMTKLTSLACSKWAIKPNKQFKETVSIQQDLRDE